MLVTASLTTGMFQFPVVLNGLAEQDEAVNTLAFLQDVGFRINKASEKE